ncbi:hypothetical protein PY650_21105 [Rhizobium calliandrae]|uniref:Uncharacterized protein n=1 Tax=Rhizobium calliandrae TaxID=1312182 RepID=A0ABT7KHI3_9HYPH|nr:hypothetical protein [Rhizobium calliandrae]MDL2408105.1 hypothetical protein [Rhizobium calliandrae]
MRHVLTRQQLYDMIWERAVSKMASSNSSGWNISIASSRRRRSEIGYGRF